MFFDPVFRKFVLKGSQPNTEPFDFGDAAAPPSIESPISAPTASYTVTTPAPADFTPAPTGPTSARNIGNFGICSVPQIKFGPGFDNRKETSFEPADESQCCRFSRKTLRH